MNAALPLALLCGVSLASAALSLLTLARGRPAGSPSGRRALAEAGQLGQSVRAMQQSLEALAEEVQELRQCPPPVSLGGAVKPGLNLNKRAQALRMHRRGDPPEEIAAKLAISRQEVDLLLKVHRIVMNRL